MNCLRTCILSVLFTKMSSAHDRCSVNICSVKESLILQIKERETQEGWVVLQVHGAGTSERRASDFLGKAPFCYPGCAVSNLVQNLCAPICQLFMPLCSHLPHLFKCWGDGTQHPCPGQGPGTHLPQPSVFSAFGLSGFANLQA